MKNIILSSVIFILAVSLNAQNFGIRAGADFATAKADFDGISLSENETGFYAGASTKVKVSESFNIRSEVNYINVEDLDQIQVPILAEIVLADKFNAMAGPSLGFLLDTEEGAKSFIKGLTLAYRTT